MRKRLKNKREKEIKNMQNLQIKTYREKTERGEKEIETEGGRERAVTIHTLSGVIGNACGRNANITITEAHAIATTMAMVSRGALDLLNKAGLGGGSSLYQEEYISVVYA